MKNVLEKHNLRAIPAGYARRARTEPAPPSNSNTKKRFLFLLLLFETE